MSTYKFKTNIQCGGCVAKVAPFMTKENGVVSWEVDTSDPQRILTVHSDQPVENIVRLVEKAGYKAAEV